MRGPERLPQCETEAGWSVHKTCVPRPQVKAYHTCRGRDWPETEDMHARKCPRPQAEGHLHACMSEADGRPRLRQA
eukprot:364588-Chlamydomonas_euryale.AAC.15